MTMFAASTVLSCMLAVGPQNPQPDPVATLSSEDLGRTKHPERQLTFFGYFLTRAELTNISPENDLFRGQVVGRLFGPNTTSTSRDRAVFLEQRFVPFFIFEPNLTNKRARMRASFELDWTFGDTSNSVGGNFGSAITADQVNLQTQNLGVEIDIARKWYVNLGLQRLYDTALDPYRATFDEMAQSGERLAFWGTDGVGVALHGTEWGQKFKLGAYLLYENLIQKDDDVALFELATDRNILRTWHVGGTLRYLRDASNGAGGVGILGQGPDSQLVEYNGGYRFTIPDGTDEWRGHFVWLGGNTSYNPLFRSGRFGGSAFAVGNFGQVVTSIAGQPGDFQKLADVLGFAGNLRAGVRYGRSPMDHVVGEFIYTSGDRNGLEDGQYTGVVTGNTWGSPAGIYTGHGAYLLLPHANVVNRYYAAVMDISNAGYGVTAGTLGVSYDLIRNKLTAKLGGAAGRSNVRPIDGSYYIGTELNGRLSWRIRPLMSLEGHAAYLWLGDYFNSPEIVLTGAGKPRNPYTVFATFKWLLM